MTNIAHPFLMTKSEFYIAIYDIILIAGDIEYLLSDIQTKDMSDYKKRSTAFKYAYDSRTTWSSDSGLNFIEYFIFREFAFAYHDFNILMLDIRDASIPTENINIPQGFSVDQTVTVVEIAAGGMTQADIDSIKHRIYQELWKDGEIIKYIIASEVSYGVLNDKTPSRAIGDYRGMLLEGMLNIMIDLMQH